MIDSGNKQSEISDGSWALRSLFVRKNIRAGRAGSDILERNSRYKAGWLKFADHAIGGNIFINAKPGFTPYADLDLETLLVNSKNTAGMESSNEYLGMGRYYSEAIDSNQRYVFLTLGVPMHNSLSNFFGSYYDAGHGKMANTGQVSEGMFHTLGKCLGQMFLLTSFPVYSILAILGKTAVKAVHDATGIPMSKYYYLKPTMALYWSTVGIIVNQIAVNMELAQSAELTVDANKNAALDADGNINNGVTEAGGADSISKADVIKAYHALLPNILRSEGGGFDVRRISSRYTAMQTSSRNALEKIKESEGDQASLEAAIQKYISGRLTDVPVIDKFEDYMTAYKTSASGTGKHLKDDLPEEIKVDGENSSNTTPDIDANSDANMKDQADKVNADAIYQKGQDQTNATGTSWFTGVWDHLTDFSDFFVNELRQGSSYIAFAVDHEPTVSESVSNTTKESEVAATMNEQSSASRTKLFNLANLNVSDNALAQAAGSVLKSVGEMMGGLAAGVGLSGLAQLGGRAFVDIPEYWDNSSTTFPTMTYTIHLRAPYGHTLSIMTNIIIPLSCLIAAAFPRATGKNSYTGPYLLKWWDKGKSQGQLGIIDSMTITRGTGSVGWNLAQQATGVDVVFTIKNLSKMTYVPISADLSISDIFGMGMFDEDTSFTDYMAILSGMGLEKQVHATKRWALRRAKFSQRMDDYWEPENLAQWAADTPAGAIASFAMNSRWANP